MTKRIYDIDAYKKTEKAKILSIGNDQRGEYLILDKTIFFPEGGGQDCDYGTIDDSNVIAVFQEKNIIKHYIDDKKELKKGTEVLLNIDWNRRYDHMQQHTGEHIFSGIVLSKFGFNSAGFHIGDEFVRIDYDNYLNEEMLEEVLKETNLAIFNSVDVKCYYPENLEGLKYRSKKEIDDSLRIVDCYYDICACCATHVKNTVEVGNAIVVSNERYKSGSRLQMLFGKRANDYSAELNKNARNLSVLFSSPVLEIYSYANNLKISHEKLQKDYNSLEREIIKLRAFEINNIKENKVIYKEEYISQRGLNTLLNLIDKEGDILIFTNTEKSSEFNFLLYSKDSLEIYLKYFKEKFEIRGGGKSPRFQGKIIATENEIEKIIDKYNC